MPKPFFSFDNSYAEKLEGTYADVALSKVANPSLVMLNSALARTLGLDEERLRASFGVQVLAGNALPEGAQPLAQAYAGHQFGGFSAQLGDGRALLLGELGEGPARVDIQLKGSGRTPFSRGGDGRATLSSVLREYLIAEAMHALHVPTTRALAAVRTGESVRRETRVPGGVLTRVASSHLRVGTFEFFAARGDRAKIEQLVEYALWRHPPSESAKEAGHDDPALTLLAAVAERQVRTVTSWLGAGFIHGVMNTDNMTISGQTIDYGPCAFMDAYDPHTVFSAIDRNGRYAYGQQPEMAVWNLTRLADALAPLMRTDNASALKDSFLESTSQSFKNAWRKRLGEKLGLEDASEADAPLLQDFLDHIEDEAPDFTNLFRTLRGALSRESVAMPLVLSPAMKVWTTRWQKRLEKESEPSARMLTVNPEVIPRNHLVEAALEAAVRGDLELYRELYEVTQRPFESPDKLAYLEPAPAEGPAYQTFCGT